MNANENKNTATTEEVRAMMTEMVEQSPNAEIRAQRELLREILTNKDFRLALKAHLFEEQMKKEG